MLEIIACSGVALKMQETKTARRPFRLIWPILLYDLGASRPSLARSDGSLNGERRTVGGAKSVAADALVGNSGAKLETSGLIE